MRTRPFPVHAARLAAALLLAACGGGGDGTTNPPPPAQGGPPASVAVQAGGDQTAPLGATLPVAPSVLVRDAENRPVAGASVTFSVGAGGGTVAGATVTTDASGVARVGGWTLGGAVGPNTLRATVAGGQSPSVDIGATARLPKWSFLVYLAADNTLTLPGLRDIEEMESVTSNPDVQVIVQAEFSPEQLRLAGATPQDANVPGANTFRYRVRSEPPNRIGPDGPITDIGNRTLTDPAELREFVQWAQATYPAERTALVLWNHGGGFAGLIEDMTSSGGRLMSLGELPAALTGLNVDLLNFDMCLMGGYETLEKLQGLTRVAVFSQELEPGEGDPYDGILQGLSANPSMDAAALGRLIVDRYDASYANGRASVTKSAYDMNAFANFDAALGTLADALTADAAALAPALREAIQGSQKFDMPFYTDLVSFLDELRPRTADPALHARIDAVRAQALAEGFRLASKARNGRDPQAKPVNRATGLHVTLPAGVADDVLPESGPASLAAYQAMYGTKPWTRFLTAWTTGGTTTAMYDQGEATRFESYLVWDSDAVEADVDVDLMIIEPNGNLYVPFLGTITPNGHLTSDSYTEDTFYEGYLTNRFVEPGRYYLLALLFSDPEDYRPIFDVQYRYAQADDFTSLYGDEPAYPELSSDVSWLDDDAFSFDRVLADAYTDLRLAASADIGPVVASGARRAPGALGAAGVQPSLRRSGGSAGSAGAGAPAAAEGRSRVRLTPQQVQTLRQELRTRRASGAAPSARRRAPAPAAARQLDAPARRVRP